MYMLVVVYPWYLPGADIMTQAKERGSLWLPEGQYLGHTTTSNYYLIC